MLARGKADSISIQNSCEEDDIILDQIKAAVVLVNYHSLHDVINMARIYESFEVISDVVIVNNDTTELEKKELNKIKGGKIDVIFKKENLGYSRGNNVGIHSLLSKSSKPKYIIISNSDIEIDECVVKELIFDMERDSRYGAMAPMMLNNLGEIVDLQAVPLGYKRLFLLCFARHLDHKMKNTLKEDKNGIIYQEHVQGSFFICKTEAMEKCGMFDPNVFLYREEEILGRRLMKKGYFLGVDKKLSYVHNHNYETETISRIIKNRRMLFVSERYFFRRYLNANLWQMLYVCLFENIWLFRDVMGHCRRSLVRYFRKK